MPFEIVRNDIATMRVDAIVNTANPRPVVGAGVDNAIHRQAGPELLKARQAIGPLAVGEAALTPGYGLAAKYVIHTVGPVWQGGGRGEEEQLLACYAAALALAQQAGCETVAFPLLSAGSYGFPPALALQTAITAFGRFLLEHELLIYLAVFDRTAFVLSEKLFRSVESYIDETYVRDKAQLEYGPSGEPDLRRALRGSPPQEAGGVYSRPSKTRRAQALDLEELLREADAGFSETLLSLIDRSGKKDAEVYKRANVDRKLFSKIRNNPAYRPSKPTALAFALALELDLAKTRELIGRAGYALTHASKFDIIVEYFILHRNYDIFELNEVLFAFDQPLIGG